MPSRKVRGLVAQLKVLLRQDLRSPEQLRVLVDSLLSQAVLREVTAQQAADLRFAVCALRAAAK